MDYETNPVWVSGMPQFGWKMVSDKRKVRQQSYKLQIAEDETFEKIIYDSGEVCIDQSVGLYPSPGCEASVRRKIFCTCMCSR